MIKNHEELKKLIAEYLNAKYNFGIRKENKNFYLGENKKKMLFSASPTSDREGNATEILVEGKSVALIVVRAKDLEKTKGEKYRIFLIDTENAESEGKPEGKKALSVWKDEKDKKITLHYPWGSDPKKQSEYWSAVGDYFNGKKEVIPEEGILFYGIVDSSDLGVGKKSYGKDMLNNLPEKVFNSLELNKNVIVEGVAGSGKSYLLKGLRDSGEYGENGNRIEVVVFHPSTSYEEFVSGIRPNFGKKSGEGDFVTQEGIFIQMCNRAAQDPDNPYLLFIDEINRANTSRVFGDLMLVLEKSKRQDFKGLSTENRDGALFEADLQQIPGEYVRLQTPIFKNGKEYNKLAVPSNLHVLGTMNTTDRSVGTIDLALRRRFHWITQHPYTADELKEAMEKAKEEYPESIASWYEKANKILLEKVGPDARLGHAYFFGKNGDEQAIADALLTQLLEIIFTFNIKEDVLKSIGVPNIDYYQGKYLGFLGEGLGKRPAVKKIEKSEPGASDAAGGATEAEKQGSEE